MVWERCIRAVAFTHTDDLDWCQKTIMTADSRRKNGTGFFGKMHRIVYS